MPRADGLGRVSGTEIIRILRKDAEVIDMTEPGDNLGEVSERCQRAQGSWQRGALLTIFRDYGTEEKGGGFR